MAKKYSELTKKRRDEIRLNALRYYYENKKGNELGYRIYYKCPMCGSYDLKLNTTKKHELEIMKKFTTKPGCKPHFYLEIINATEEYKERVREIIMDLLQKYIVK